MSESFPTDTHVSPANRGFNGGGGNRTRETFPTENPRSQAVIRWLKRGDSVPTSEPRRYNRGDGYVLLRWKVGVQEYVEALEHRLVMGFPDGEIHHRDGNKKNNDPSNLEITTKVAHARHHGEEYKARSKRVTEWYGMRSRAAYEKRERRLARECERAALDAQIVALHRQGLTTIAIGVIVDRDPSNVTRALQRVGIR